MTYILRQMEYDIIKDACIVYYTILYIGVYYD
jgi:hypothetical protein